MSSPRDAGATREAHPWSQRLGVWWIAEDHPDLTAIAASPSGVTLTFAELAGRAHQLVHALRSRGFAPGDTIAYDLPNSVDIVVWQLATQESGLRSISLNPSSSAGEIHRILEHSGTTGLALHHRFADRAAEATRSIPLRLAISVEGDIDGFEPQAALVAGHPTTAPDHRRLGGAISYSSGTTGDPKAIVRRLPDLDPWAVADSIKSFGHAFRFLPLEGAHLVSAGMHHGGCQGFYHGALNVGQALVIQGKFEPEEALRLIEEHRVTSAYMVPTQFVRFLKLAPEVRNRYDHSSLQTVVHSAAPCPPEIKRRMLEWWGPVVWETYGGMEGAATIAKPYRWLEKPGTVARHTIAGTKVRILDADGNDLPANEIGNVYLESPGSAFEYRGDPEATAAAFRGKAFTIGDVGYLDDDGYLFLCDRARDIIISGGVNIYPAEVEGTLISHPSVADAAVIGVPDTEWGEQVKAVVELVDGAEPNAALAETLQAWCRERLAGYKCPRSVDFREQLPRREDGKLLKRLLRDEYWAGTGRKL